MKYIGAHDLSSATVTYGVNRPIDAVVAATGGDYTTLGAALTAGKKSIFIKNGSYSETSITISTNNITVIGESVQGVIITFSNQLTISGVDVTFQNLTIKSSVNGTFVNISGSYVNFIGCEIWNTANSNPGAESGILYYGAAAFKCMVSNCLIMCRTGSTAQSNRYGINVLASSYGHRFDNLIIDCNNNTTTSPATTISGDNITVNGVIVLNALNVGYYSGANQIISNITCRGTSASATFTMGLGMTDSTVSNLYLDTCAVNIYTCSYSQFSNIKADGLLTLNATYPTLHSNWSNCDFGGGIIINTGSNYNSFSNCKAGVDAGGGAATITVASGSTGTTITGCRTDAAISDSGTDTAGIGNRVY